MYKLLFILSAFVISGCVGSGLDQVKSDMTSINPDKAIVMFSIDTEESVEGQNLGLLWLTANGEYQRGSIRQTPSDGPLQRFILEVPGNFVVFDTISIKYGRDWWIAGGSRKVELTTGKLTYVGRIEIQDIQYEKNFSRSTSGESGESKWPSIPVSIRIGFIDQSESDLTALKLKYSIFEEYAVSKDIPQNWGQHTYMPLSMIPKSVRGPMDPVLADFLKGIDIGYDPF